MKLSTCEKCGRLVQFEQAACRGCGAPLGFVPAAMDLVGVSPAGEGRVHASGRPGEAFRPCVNAEANGCNWLVPDEDPERRCVACRLNRNLADMSVPLHRRKWRLVECAKRRLIYALLRLGQRVAPKGAEEARGLAFDFLIGSKGAPVITGHANGLVTINLLEADSVERERQRVALNEPYRTLLGHFRHETGHHYQNVLVEDAGRTAACRAVFGDDSADYREALDAYYANGPTPGWEEAFVSGYATMHPWEDFAETWAHYLHIVDTLDTGAGFGLSVNPKVGANPRDATVIDFDPYRPPSFENLVEAWLPLTEAVNSLNRSMGQPDLYPFDLAPKVVEKLGFIHDLLQPVDSEGEGPSAPEHPSA
jgi:hypothetical protein